MINENSRMQPRPEAIDKEGEKEINLLLGRLGQALAEGESDWHNPRIERDLGVLKAKQQQLALQRRPGEEETPLEKRIFDMIVKIEKANIETDGK